MDTRERKKELSEVKLSPFTRQLVMKAIDIYALRQLPMLTREHNPRLTEILFQFEQLKLQIQYDRISIHEFYRALDKLAKQWDSEELNEEIESFIEKEPLDRISNLKMHMLPAEVNAFFQRCFYIREMQDIQIKAISENEEDKIIFKMIERHIDLLRYEFVDTDVVAEIHRLFKEDTAMRDRYLLELLLRIILDDKPKTTEVTQIIKEIKKLAAEVRQVTHSLSLEGGSYLATPLLSFMLYVVSPSFQYGSKKIAERFLTPALSDEFTAALRSTPSRHPITCGQKRIGLLKELALRQSVYQTDLLDEAFHSHAGYIQTLVLRLTALDYFNKRIQSGDALNPEEIREDMQEVFGNLFVPMYETRGWGSSYITSFIDQLNLPAVSKSGAVRPLTFFHQAIDQMVEEKKPDRAKKAGW